MTETSSVVEPFSLQRGIFLPARQADAIPGPELWRVAPRKAGGAFCLKLLHSRTVVADCRRCRCLPNNYMDLLFFEFSSIGRANPYTVVGTLCFDVQFGRL